MIAVDVSGGDYHGPKHPDNCVEVARGVGFAINTLHVPATALILLCSQKDAGVLLTSRRLWHVRPQLNNVEIKFCPEGIPMSAKPKEALRASQSTIYRGLELVRSGSCAAFFSAGNTAAMYAVAHKLLGLIEGVPAPAIAATIPAQMGQRIWLDVGASMKVDPHYLHMLALMGTVYAQATLNTDRPRVGLLNFGKEDEKGDLEVLQPTCRRLRRDCRLNFCGNVEGYDLLSAPLDVIVGSGYAFNTLVKFAQSFLEEYGVLGRVVKAVSHNRLARRLRQMFTRRDYVDPDEVGGGPMLGFRHGVVVTTHGHSNYRRIGWGIFLTYRLAQLELAKKIQDLVSQNPAPS